GLTLYSAPATLRDIKSNLQFFRELPTTKEFYLNWPSGISKARRFPTDVYATTLLDIVAKYNRTFLLYPFIKISANQLCEVFKIVYQSQKSKTVQLRINSS
ncbi:hypothetical protein PFISCL1PPCAC_11648, partial [Pristionchus fissidentatus]